MAANISSLWTDKRSILSRSIPRWFVRVVGRGKRDFPPRFDWKKTFDSKRGFYFSRGLPSPPLPLSREQCPFSLARGRSNLDFQMKASPTIYFLCSALVKFEGREGEREKKEELGHRTDIPTEPQTLTKVFRTEEQSPLCLCPLSLEHCAPGY